MKVCVPIYLLKNQVGNWFPFIVPMPLKLKYLDLIIAFSKRKALNLTEVVIQFDPKIDLLSKTSYCGRVYEHGGRTLRQVGDTGGTNYYGIRKKYVTNEYT